MRLLEKTTLLFFVLTLLAASSYAGGKKFPNLKYNANDRAVAIFLEMEAPCDSRSPDGWPKYVSVGEYLTIRVVLDHPVLPRADFTIKSYKDRGSGEQMVKVTHIPPTWADKIGSQIDVYSINSMGIDFAGGNVYDKAGNSIAPVTKGHILSPLMHLTMDMCALKYEFNNQKRNK